jgi:hypothetical protein
MLINKIEKFKIDLKLIALKLNINVLANINIHTIARPGDQDKRNIEIIPKQTMVRNAPFDITNQNVKLIIEYLLTIGEYRKCILGKSIQSAELELTANDMRKIMQLVQSTQFTQSAGIKNVAVK